MTAMRPDPNSEEAAGTEYGNDTGFAAEATRTGSDEPAATPEEQDPDPAGTTVVEGPGDGAD